MDADADGGFNMINKNNTWAGVVAEGALAVDGRQRLRSVCASCSARSDAFEEFIDLKASVESGPLVRRTVNAPHLLASRLDLLDESPRVPVDRLESLASHRCFLDVNRELVAGFGHERGHQLVENVVVVVVEQFADHACTRTVKLAQANHGFARFRLALCLCKVLLIGIHRCNASLEVVANVVRMELLKLYHKNIIYAIYYG